MDEDRVVANACLTAVGFPETVAEVLDLVGGVQKGGGYGPTNMELLLDPTAAGFDWLKWSAPRWMVDGDLVFYYHTKRAILNIRRLLKESTRAKAEGWDGLPDRKGFVELLEDQLDIAERLSGTIFAVSRVIGDVEITKPEDRSEDRHWRGLVFAPVSLPDVFEVPLSDTSFTEFLSLSRGGTITNIYRDSFGPLKAALARDNVLPSYLGRARFGELTFRDVRPENWLTFATNPAVRFVTEAQLRAYLLDHLLEQVKDSGTTVYRECRCPSGGIADYFVQVNGCWLPVEAKLSVLSERDLPAQVGAYLDVPSFHPQLGTGRGKSFKGSRCNVCLVGDAIGLYLVGPNGFVSCTANRPLWRRHDFDPSIGANVRQRLIDAVESRLKPTGRRTRGASGHTGS